MILLATAAQGATANAQAPSMNPCTDSTYVALKHRNVDSLSTREYEMFRDRDKACLATMSRSDTLSAVAAPVQAGVAPSDAAMSLAAGQASGRSAASEHGTGGWFAGGFASGVGLGLIGTAIIYIAAANSTSLPTPGETTALAEKPPVYAQGYRDAYGSELKSKKKTSALAGGLLGTLTFVLLYTSSQSH